MSDAQDDKPGGRRGLLMPLAVGLVLAVAAGGGGYWAVAMGPLAPARPEPQADAGDASAADMASDLPSTDVVFVPLEPVVITLGPEALGQHFLFSAHLEVPPTHQEEVTRLLPRVLDVLNGYLRVVSPSELGDPESLGIIRAQLLRRIQVVTGPGRVQDLLVTQFVVN